MALVCSSLSAFCSCAEGSDAIMSENLKHVYRISHPCPSLSVVRCSSIAWRAHAHLIVWLQEDFDAKEPMRLLATLRDFLPSVDKALAALAAEASAQRSRSAATVYSQASGQSSAATRAKASQRRGSVSSGMEDGGGMDVSMVSDASVCECSSH